MKESQLKLLISEIVKQVKLLEDSDPFGKQIESPEGSMLYLHLLDIANMDDPSYRLILALKQAITKKIKDPTEFQAFVGIFNREFGGSHTGQSNAWEYFTPEGLKESSSKPINEGKLSPRGMEVIQRWCELGNREAGIKIIDNILSRKIGLKSADLTDSSTFAGGLDSIEEALDQKDYQGAYDIAIDTATSMIEEEGGELQEGLEEGSGKWKALAAAGLLGYAGLHTQFGKQMMAKAGQTPIAQKMSQAMKPVSVPNPNQPLPDEKNMNAWDLTNKYVNRNADIEKKTAPFVKKYLPPVTQTVREVIKPDESFFPTLDKALEAVELYLDKNKAVVDDNEHPKDEKVDSHGIRKPFMFGGIVYEKSKEAHYKLLTLNGNFTRKYLHVIIYRMPQGSYELTRYIA